MFIRLNQNTVLESYISQSYKLYEDDIMTLHIEQFNQEDICGESKKQFKVLNYHIATLYVVFIYNDIVSRTNNLLEWSYFEEKYCVDKYRDAFACKGIDLDKILNIFGLPYVSSNGIGGMQIETNFVIEPLGTTPPDNTTFDMTTLLAETSGCENYIEDGASLGIHLLIEVIDGVEIHLSI